MADLIITPSLGKIDFIHQSAQAPRVESIILHEEDGLVFTGKISASSVTAPLNVINVTAGSSNVNYPFIFASSGETGAKSLLMDSAGGTYNPSINTATIDISGNSATTTLASDSTNLGGVAAASYVTLTGTQTLTNKTITGTFTGNLTGTGSWATNAVSAVSATTATNSTQLNGQAASYYTNIPARLGYTPVNKIGDTISGDLVVNGNFSVNGSFTAFSASNIYLSSSVLTVEDNILTLNAFSPYLRYAGIEMYDSGSGTLSQLLWDGDGDYFFLTGSSVNGKIITGPDNQANLSSNFVPKATAGYKLGNSLIYDNGTNIGIGTTSPSNKITIEADATGVSFADNDIGQLVIRGSTNTAKRLGLGIDTTNNIGVIQAQQYGTGQYPLTLNPAGGNVGIGTTSPGTKLDVVGGVRSFASVGNYGLITNGSFQAVGNHGGTFMLDLNNTGEADLVNIKKSGVSRFYIKNDGNVGIGTTIPVAKLQVNSTTPGDTLFRTDGTNGTLFSVVDDLSDSLMSVNNSAGLPVFEVFADDRIVAGQYGQNDFVVRNNKVGIGTNNPSKLLHVAGDMVVATTSKSGTIFFGTDGGTETYIRRDNNYDLIVAQNDASGNGLYLAGAGSVYVSIDSNDNGTTDAFIVQNNSIKSGTELFRIQENGNVGIGTTIPTTPLHVVGVISGSSFSGAGTGLTGTAASLTVGNATSASYALVAATANNVNNATLTVEAGTGISLSATPTFTSNASVDKTIIVTNSSPNATHTGDVTGATTLTIANDAVTTAKILNANVTNAKLANSSVTIGSTAISLGGTTTTLPGLTSITSTTVNATTVNTTNISASATGSFGIVGIGTTTPNKQLTFGQVNDDAIQIRRITVGSGGPSVGTGISWTWTSANTDNETWAAIRAIFPGNGDSHLTFANRPANGVTTERMRIQNDGNVGIGTTSPITKLDVRSGYITAGTNTSTAGTVILGGYYNDGNLTVLGTEYSSGGPMLGYGVIPSTSSAGAFFSSTGINIYRSAYVQDGGTHRWYTGGVQTVTTGNSVTISEKMRMDTNGNIGIGTTSPTAKVESYYSSNAITFNYLATNLNGNSPIPVYGFDVTSGAEARSIKAGIGYERHEPNGRGTIHFYNDSANDTQSLSGNRSSAGDIKMSIDNSGNVGIGSVIPAYKLDVNGSFRTATGNLTIFNDYIYVSPTNTNTLNSGYGTNGIADLWINFRGYQDLQTQFRNFNVGNGKGDNIAWFDGTNKRLSLNNGQVASYTLHVNGSGYFSSTLQVNSNITVSGGGDIIINDSDGTGFFASFMDSGIGYIRIDDGGSGDGKLNINNGLVYIQGAGNNVGIGTTVPGQKLDVEGRIRTRGATGTGGFEIGAATTGAAKWRIEWDSASDSLDFNWVG